MSIKVLHAVFAHNVSQPLTTTSIKVLDAVFAHNVQLNLKFDTQLLEEGIFVGRHHHVIVVDDGELCAHVGRAVRHMYVLQACNKFIHLLLQLQEKAFSSTQPDTLGKTDVTCINQPL